MLEHANLPFQWRSEGEWKGGEGEVKGIITPPPPLSDDLLLVILSLSLVSYLNMYYQ